MKITDNDVATKTPDELRAMALALLPADFSAERAIGCIMGAKLILDTFRVAGKINEDTSFAMYGELMTEPRFEAGAMLRALEKEAEEMQIFVRSGLASMAGGTPQ